MGPPGSGKGTQVGRLAERVGVSRMSTGDLFRSHQERDTELGRLARGYMEAGEYVPDDITIQMVMEWVNAPSQAGGFVLDGFPRTSGQAEALDRGVASLGGIDQVVYMAVPRDELMRRLTGRLVCRGCQTPYHIDSAPPAVEGSATAAAANCTSGRMTGGMWSSGGCRCTNRRRSPLSTTTVGRGSSPA